MACAAKKCENKAYNCNLSFFTFPKENNRARAQRWLVACGREDLQERIDKLDSYRLCAAHFEAKMYMNDIKTRLLPTAVPTRFYSMEGSSIQDKHVDHNYCVTSGQTSVARKCEQQIPADEHELPQKIKIILDVVLDKPISISVISPTETSILVSPPRSSPESTQTGLKLSCGTPRKHKLRQCIKKLRNDNSHLKINQLQDKIVFLIHTIMRWKR